jgi:hypothetical protein
MSETSVNPNVNMTTTDTTVDGKLELNSASGPVSFDELEQITESAKKSKSSKAKAEKESGDDKSQSKNEKSIDLSSDNDKGKKSEAKSKPETDPQGEKSEASKNAEAEKQIRKLIKAKFQDRDIDLDEESLVPVKINGKEEMVQIKDLLGNYSGKVAYDKKFTELSKTTKQQAATELRLKQAAESVKSIFTETDLDTRIYKLSRLAGVDPVQYRDKFLNENINLLEKWYGMSEDERKADALAYENKFNKHRADTLEASIKQEQSQRELSAKLDNLRASHQVSEDDFIQQYDQISKMVDDKLLDGSKVTPEFVIETINKDRLWNAADSQLSSLNLPWNSEQKGQRVMKLVEDAYHLGLKPEDMADMVDEIWGHKKAQKKVQQISDERREFLSGKKPVTQSKPRTEAPIFFEDI